MNFDGRDLVHISRQYREEFLLVDVCIDLVRLVLHVPDASSRGQKGVGSEDRGTAHMLVGVVVPKGGGHHGQVFSVAGII